VEFNASGELLATAGLDGVVQVWRVTDGKLLSRLEGPSEGIEFIAWHPQGDIILAGSGDCTAWMWNAGAGTNMQVFAGHTAEILCGGFTTDGKRVITASVDGSLRVWDPRSGVTMRIVSGHPFHACAVTFMSLHPNGVVVFTGGDDGSVCVTNLENGRVVTTLVGHGDSIEAIAVHPSLPYVVSASSDGKCFVWDSATFQRRLDFSQEYGITRALWIGQTHLLLTAGLDGTVRIFDVQRGTPILEKACHGDHILDAKISPDGEYIITGSDDKTSRIFKVRE